MPHAEYGNLKINHSWTTIEFNRSFIDPVVIIKSTTVNGKQPVHVRIKDVRCHNFTVKLEEWEYSDGIHKFENVSFIVFDKGEHIISGKRIIVGKAEINHRFNEIFFNDTDTIFQEPPVVFTQSQTFEGSDPIVTRNKKITNRSVFVKVQEEEGSHDKGWHKREIVGYIAMEEGLYPDFNNMEIGKTQNTVNHTWSDIFFDRIYSNPPALIMDMQTTKGIDTAELRYKWRPSHYYKVEVRAEEERSKDFETRHLKESIGYMVLRTV